MDEVSFNPSGNQITLVKRRTNPLSMTGRPPWEEKEEERSAGDSAGCR